ncbi:RNA-binding Raly-like protein isoform X1 [Xyrauchen texanus]|uniref:RNA-binding Raly-like protein isoform X1 n=1 Tax=Xyrauchen texanus TaxID=154827 RepID=UPI002241ECA8|nr:RNA-binding Raly-like protein isoform X1 [Xyrauchen texanus]
MPRCLLDRPWFLTVTLRGSEFKGQESFIAKYSTLNLMDMYRKTLHKAKRHTQRYINMTGEPRPYRPIIGSKHPFSLYSGYEFDHDFYRDDFYSRFFNIHGRLAPSPRAMIPIKHSRLVTLTTHRKKDSFQPKMPTCSSYLRNLSPVKSDQLMTIKQELSQIQIKIDSLMGRLERIEQKQVAEAEAHRMHEKAYQSLYSERAKKSEEEVDQEHQECGSWEITDEGDNDYDDNVNNDELIENHISDVDN